MGMKSTKPAPGKASKPNKQSKKAVRNSKRKSPARKMSPLRKRLWIVTTLLTLLCAGGAGAFYAVKMSAESDAPEIDIEGLMLAATENSEREEHAAVIDQLGPHITTAFRDDSAALRLYADSRTMVPTKDNTHLLDAIRIYRRVLTLDPQDSKTARELFYLYTVIGETDKAVEIGETALTNGITDVEFKLSLCNALLTERKYEAAIELADDVLLESPSNLDAYRLRLSSMVEQKLPEDDVLGYVSKVTDESRPEAPSRNQLMMLVAESKGDEELVRLLTRKISVEKPSNPNFAIQLADQLARAEDLDASLSVLESASLDSTATTECDLPLLYRYLQDSRFQDVADLISKKFANSAEQPEEVTIVAGLAQWMSDPSQDLAPVTQQLGKSETLLSRTWQSTFQAVGKLQTNPLDLLKVTKQATDTYPRSAYLHFFHGLAYASLGESDMAVEIYRKAVRLAPRWGFCRVQLADTLIGRGQYRTAFVEASSALRANPQFGRGFESILVSAAALVAMGDELPPQQLEAIVDVLDGLTKQTQDEQQSRLLNAFAARFQGKTQETDELIQSYLAASATLDEEDLRIALTLVTDEELLTSIQERAQQVLGLTLGQLIDQAVELGKDDEAKGLAFIQEFQVDGEALPTKTQQIATARFLSRIESESAKEAWLKLAEENSTDVRVLQMVLGSNELKTDFEARQSLVEKLKQATSEDSLSWKTAEIRLMLDKDPSERTAAAAVLRLDEIIREAPTAVAPYALMTEAYTTLKQPLQIVQLLQRAVDRGLNIPAIRLTLAETLMELNDPGKAMPHAIAVQENPRSNFLARQRAVQVMLNAESYRTAAESLQKDLPATFADTDQDYAMFGAYALACLRSNTNFDAPALVDSLCQDKTRWFGIWLDLATDPEIDPSLASQWLDQAQNWLEQDEPERRRQLSKAYRKLSALADKQTHLENSLRVLSPVLSSDQVTAIDRMSQATTLESLGRAEEAVPAYQSVANDEAVAKTLRAIAMNNLALLFLNQDDSTSAERLIERAIEFDRRPDFGDTKSIILAAQEAHDTAQQVLSEWIAEYPDELGLKVRLAETYQATGQLTLATELLEAIKVQTRTTQNTSSLKIWQRIRNLEQRQHRLLTAEDANELSQN